MADELRFANPLGGAGASDGKKKDGEGSSTPVRAVRAARADRLSLRPVV